MEAQWPHPSLADMVLEPDVPGPSGCSQPRQTRDEIAGGQLHVTVPSSGFPKGWESQWHLVTGRLSQDSPRVMQAFPSLPNAP